MKILLLPALILPLAIMAQSSAKDLEKHREKVQKSLEKGKNIRSLDTLFASGKPYCIMKGLKKGIGGPIEYTIRPLKRPDREEVYMLMSAEGTGASAIWYWDMVFVNLGQKIRFQNGTLDPENTLVEYELFNDSGLNAAGVNKLVLLKGGQQGAGAVPAPAAAGNGPELVQRNRGGMIQVFGERINQGGVHVGNITSVTSAVNGGIITRYTITTPAGALVATAQNNGATDHNWTIVTAKDNRSQQVNSTLAHDAVDIARYLVEALYL